MVSHQIHSQPPLIGDSEASKDQRATEAVSGPLEARAKVFLSCPNPYTSKTQLLLAKITSVSFTRWQSQIQLPKYFTIRPFMSD